MRGRAVLGIVRVEGPRNPLIRRPSAATFSPKGAKGTAERTASAKCNSPPPTGEDGCSRAYAEARCCEGFTRPKAAPTVLKARSTWSIWSSVWATLIEERSRGRASGVAGGSARFRYTP